MESKLIDYAERLAALETGINALTQVCARLESKLDAWQATYVPRTEINEAFKARDERIKSLENNQTWLWRTTVGAVIAGAIGIVFAFIKINVGV